MKKAAIVFQLSGGLVIRADYFVIGTRRSGTIYTSATEIVGRIKDLCEREELSGPECDYHLGALQEFLKSRRFLP